MYLSDSEVEKVIVIAKSYIGRKREPGFKCVEFVCQVYEEAGITVPRLIPTEFPPQDFCLTKDELTDPPAGRPLFLYNKNDWRPRKWTHLVITLPNHEVVHCSYFFGKKVVITSLEKILEKYDFVESPALTQ